MKKLLTVFLITAMLIAIIPPTFTVGADTQASLTTDKTTYLEGEPILVTAKSTNSSGKDWVGIMQKGNTEGVSIYWDYLNVMTENYDISKATHKGKDMQAYYSLPAGEYTIILMPNDLTIKKGYDQILKMVDITIKENPNSDETTPNAPPALTPPAQDTYLITDKSTYTVGDPIWIMAASQNASGKDWVGIFPKDHIGPSIYWDYLTLIGMNKAYDIKKSTHQGASLSAYFGIPAGEYTLYLIPNNYDGIDGIPHALARVDIKVTGDPTKKAKAPISVTYTLDNEKDGMADGKLTVKLPEGHNADDIYMWWGNDSGKLAGYTRLARFKVTGTTVTHNMTANTLIPQGATKLLVYSYNDANGLSEDFFEVKLPEGAASKDLGKVLSEFQIVSDIHIKGDATHEYSKHFVAMLNDVVKNSPSSAGIFTVGDNVDRGDKPEYWTYFNNLYKSVSGAPAIYLGIGNHEYIGTSYDSGLAQFLANVKLPDGAAPTAVNYDCYVNGYHYIYIGTSETGTSAAISRDVLRWLDETLKKDTDGKPVFLFLHQPMLNTVSGSSTSEGWSGISNHKELKSVLDKYPNVIMFNGHTHWILDSDNCMFDGDGKTATIFNTASVAYLWHSYDVPTGERMTGSEGYYIRVYEDKIAVLGRNFVTGEWVSSAQFIVKLDKKSADETTKAEETTKAPEATSAPTVSDVTEETKSPETEAPKSGCGSLVGSLLPMLSIIAGGVILLIKRKKL